MNILIGTKIQALSTKYFNHKIILSHCLFKIWWGFFSMNMSNETMIKAFYFYKTLAKFQQVCCTHCIYAWNVITVGGVLSFITASVRFSASNLMKAKIIILLYWSGKCLLIKTELLLEKSHRQKKKIYIIFLQVIALYPSTPGKWSVQAGESQRTPVQCFNLFRVALPVLD